MTLKNGTSDNNIAILFIQCTDSWLYRQVRKYLSWKSCSPPNINLCITFGNPPDFRWLQKQWLGHCLHELIRLVASSTSHYWKQQPIDTNDCNPESWDWRSPNSRILGLQKKLLKTVLFRVSHNKINNNSGHLMKYFGRERVLAVHCKLHFDSHCLQFGYTYITICQPNHD